MKTNGARFLESLGIPFELREYEVDPERSFRHHRRQKDRHARPSRSSKRCSTTGGPNIYVFAVIPGDAELDFKKLARAAGLRKAEMAPLKDVQPLTGYIRGGVTVFGARKPYPVFVDETVDPLRQDQRLRRHARHPAHPHARRLSPRRPGPRSRSPDRRPDQSHVPARAPGAPGPASGTWERQ